MFHTDSPHQFYAQLSQVVSDSDDSEEEEIHNTSKHQRHRLQQQQLQLQRQQLAKYNRNPPPKTLALNQQTVNGHQPSSYTTNMQNSFRSMMMSDLGMNSEGTHCNFSSFSNEYDDRNIDADNVAILGNTSKDIDVEPMSHLRRFCFICSLLLCVLMLFGFIWLLPCAPNGICPAELDRIKTHNWLNNYTKIELKAGINVVSGLRNWENNLIFLYRGDAFFPEFQPSNTKRNGIISLIGHSGAVAWYDEMIDDPVAIDCTLVDVDRNGRPDCLVLDEYGELGAINPISGQWHWRFKERSAHKVDAGDFPVILPDLDGDGVLELLMITSPALEQRTKGYVRKGELKHGTHVAVNERNILRIISGSSGKPIFESFKIRDCDILRKLQLENEMITFNCLRNQTEVQRYKTLADLFALITNKSTARHKLLASTAEISQHRQHKDMEQRNVYSLSGRELLVENRGICPDDCNVTFILSEVRNGEVNILRNFTNSGMYGMVPEQWHFHGKKTRRHMSGFVMKFWKWNDSKEFPNITSRKANDNTTAFKKSKSNATKENGTKAAKQNQTQGGKREKSHRQKRELDHEFPTKEFSAFDHLIQKRHTYTVTHELRVPRSVANATNKQQKLNSSNNSNNNMLLDNYKMQMITETVILVLFIGADTRIENTSQSNIVQFCRHNNERSEVPVCQPDLNHQENSMLIADLDEDGSQELVSYTSTFVQPGDDPQDWKLISYVRLLRLQSELPAFYDAERRY